MKLIEVISNETLKGIPLNPADRGKILSFFGKLTPAWFLDFLTERNVAGSMFSVSEEMDLSSMGVELKWMTAEQMIDEATKVYPGIFAIKKGYLPFGICLEGSGDPYFLKIGKAYQDTPVVRIPHNGVIDEQVDDSSIETVASNLAIFFENSIIS